MVSMAAVYDQRRLIWVVALKLSTFKRKILIHSDAELDFYLLSTKLRSRFDNRIIFVISLDSLNPTLSKWQGKGDHDKPAAEGKARASVCACFWENVGGASNNRSLQICFILCINIVERNSAILLPPLPASAAKPSVSLTTETTAGY